VRGDGAGRSARAGWVLALALAAAAAAPDSSREPCASPGERIAADGWSVELSCGRGGAALRGPARLLFGLGVDPNRADLETLEVLPGIGPSRARALVTAREGRPFCAPRDLERVKGIGPGTRVTLAGWLVFPPTGAEGCRAQP
jgi:competence protein ComEA